MKKQMIKDMRIGDEVETQALVLEANKAAFNAPHRAGEHFFKLILGDVSGRVKAVMWDPPDQLSTGPGDVVFIRGQVGEYHGPQVVVSDLRKLDPAKVNRAFFQPVSRRSPEEMMGELKQVMEKEIRDQHLQALMKVFFEDGEFARRFSLAPAARTIHHNYLSGLLEHTLEVIYFCRSLAAVYKEEIQLELLLAGAILHDAGKLEEYCQDSLSFEFTDRGKLIGHISIGKEMLDKRLEKLPGFPAALRLELEHMILTHHGVREWGSPEIPKTIHAYALFHADMLSARLNQFITVKNRHSSESGDWTEWDRFLERSIYVPPPEETS